jgi:hypothetical protein
MPLDQLSDEPAVKILIFIRFASLAFRFCRWMKAKLAEKRWTRRGLGAVLYKKL